jgi:menaquinol-cytochrome c reductase cytochrome b/c subunit
MARLTARERREAYLREYAYQKKTGKSFFPQVILHDIVVNLFFVLLIIGLTLVWYYTADGEKSGILGPWYEGKADAAVAVYDPRPDWYYFFLFQLLRIFDNPNLLLLGTIIVPSIWMGILVTLPFIDRTRERRVSRRPIAIGFAGAMAVLLLTLTWKGSSAPNIGGEATATGAGIAFTKSQSCSSCHTLKPLGWGGNIGPNLEGAKPNYDLVLDRVTNGQGGMPSFKGTLSAAQIKCIATVVSTVSKGGGSPSAQAVACKDFA